MIDSQENFHQKLRDLAPVVSEARVKVLTAEATLKKIFWVELCRAKDEGERSYNAQKSKAESTENYYKASMDVAVAKAGYESCQIEKQSVDMAFEEWRTKMANLRSERNRYGA